MCMQFVVIARVLSSVTQWRASFCLDCLELKPLARSQQHGSGGGGRPRFCLAARPSSRSWRSAASASSTATPHHLLFYSLHMLSTALLIPLRLCPSRGASSSSSSIFVGLFLRRFDRLFVLFVRLFTVAPTASYHVPHACGMHAAVASFVHRIPRAHATAAPLFMASPAQTCADCLLVIHGFSGADVRGPPIADFSGATMRVGPSTCPSMIPSAACRRGASDGPVFPFVCRVSTRSFRRTCVLLVCRASSRSSDDP